MFLSEGRKSPDSIGERKEENGRKVTLFTVV